MIRFTPQSPEELQLYLNYLNRNRIPYNFIDEFPNPSPQLEMIFKVFGEMLLFFVRERFKNEN